MEKKLIYSPKKPHLNQSCVDFVEKEVTILAEFPNIEFKELYPRSQVVYFIKEFQLTIPSEEFIETSSQNLS